MLSHKRIILGERKSIFESLEYQKLHFLANHLTKCDYHQSELAPGNPLLSGSCWPKVPEKKVFYFCVLLYLYCKATFIHFQLLKAPVGQSLWD